MSIADLIARRVLPGIVAVLLGAAGLAAQQPAPAAAPPVPNDLDLFMAKVLEKRNENWRALHDYILNERETFEVLGPLGVPLHSLQREFHWSIREGYLVRTPVKANGVAVSADQRAAYEKKWLEEEQRREKKQAAKQQADKQPTEKQQAGKPAPPDDPQITVSLTDGVEMAGFSGQGPEPRFISESYFMNFKFEPGNYYFAGREQLDGREVLKIEYLPSDLFSDDREKKKAAEKAGPGAGKPADKPGRTRDRDEDDDEKIERAMNKTSTVTMWIDPREYQIVRFTFDNVDWGFLPGRQFVRIDDARASMTMGLVFESVWLPKDVSFGGSATFAGGTVRLRYAREFYDYRRGEVSARIRAYVPKEPE